MTEKEIIEADMVVLEQILQCIKTDAIAHAKTHCIERILELEKKGYSSDYKKRGVDL